MMTSPKEEGRQQISDYDILFIKGWWLVDKSNSPLPFVTQENRGGMRGNPPPHPPHDYEGQKYPVTNRVNTWFVLVFSLYKSSLFVIMEYVLLNKEESMRKLEKIMIKYSSYTNHVWFSLRCHHNKVLPKDLQLKRWVKTERSKIILQVADKLLKERIHINHVSRDKLKDSIEQLRGKILESITPDNFHLVEKIYENSYKKSFDLTKKRHIRKFDELISKNKVTHSATNITWKEMGY